MVLTDQLLQSSISYCGGLNARLGLVWLLVLLTGATFAGLGARPLNVEATEKPPPTLVPLLPLCLPAPHSGVYTRLVVQCNSSPPLSIETESVFQHGL